MSLGILLCLLTGIAVCGPGIFTSLVVKRDCDFLVYGIRSNLVACLGAALFLIHWQTLRSAPPAKCVELIVIMAAVGLLQATSFWFIQRAMRDGPHAFIWTICQTALVVPFLVSVLFWHEPMGFRKFAGLALIVCGIFIIGRSGPASPGASRGGGLWILFAFLAFALNGTLQSLNSIPSHWAGWQDTAGLRTPLLFAGICTGSAGLRWITPKQKKNVSWLFAASGGIVSIIGIALLYVAMDRLATFQMAGLAYPIIIGACIVSFAIYGRFALAETPSKMGLAITVAGLAAIAC